jgi:hypothetical protein
MRTKVGIENLFRLHILVRNRHVEADSASGGLYAFLSRQVNKGIVTIQERLGEFKLGCRRQDDWHKTNLVHTL